MKKAILMIVVFWIALVVFLPKERIYFTFEKALERSHISIKGEHIEDNIFFLDVSGGELLYERTKIGSIDSLKLTPWLFYNTVRFEGIAFEGDYELLFPGRIDHLAMKYSVLHPMTVGIEAQGGFGPMRGEIDMESKRMKFVFEASQQMRRYPLLLSKLRKTDEGLIYETSF